MYTKIKSYLDLTRIHFAPVWPLLFVTGLMLAFRNYGDFSWILTLKVACIGLFGFEAGMVLNDIFDARYDERDVEFDKLTRYWRPFGKRPIPSNQISRLNAIILAIIFFIIALLLILTLPSHHRTYLLLMIPLTYSLEAFYNFKKRRQKLPLAQLVGRLDFTLFPIAGYLCFGHPDHTVLLFILFFYPLAEVHLGINDLADIRNDEARQLQTVGTMYGIKGTICWIQIFSGLHIITAAVFLLPKGIFTVIAFITGLLLLLIANLIISAQKTPEAGLKALPLLHATLAVYITGIIIQSAVNI